MPYSYSTFRHLPYTFTIVSDYPESPRNCSLRNATNNGLEVTCTAGSDGGLQQNFVLEVTEISAPTERGGVTTLSDQGYRTSPLYRVLGDEPLFRLHSLQPGREYQLQVYAVNAKGRSTPPIVMANVRVETPMDGLSAGPNSGDGTYTISWEKLNLIKGDSNNNWIRALHR